VLTSQESKIPQSVIDNIIKQVDANGDGQISLDEFTQLMRNASL